VLIAKCRVLFAADEVLFATSYVLVSVSDSRGVSATAWCTAARTTAQTKAGAQAAQMLKRASARRYTRKRASPVDRWVSGQSRCRDVEDWARDGWARDGGAAGRVLDLTGTAGRPGVAERARAHA
jgi:hypothetical protein